MTFVLLAIAIVVSAASGIAIGWGWAEAHSATQFRRLARGRRDLTRQKRALDRHVQRFLLLQDHNLDGS